MITHTDYTRDNYHLRLPNDMRIHPVSLLHRYKEPEVGRQVSQPGPVIDGEYEVDKLLAKRLRCGR